VGFGLPVEKAKNFEARKPIKPYRVVARGVVCRERKVFICAVRYRRKPQEEEKSSHLSILHFLGDKERVRFYFCRPVF
jgi:hypothetical protein